MTSNSRLKNVQVFRGSLFFFVLAFHCDVPGFSIGWGGVVSFFVISSFFLTKKYYSDKSFDIIRQIKHRLIRLYPPYILMIIAVVFLVAFNTGRFRELVVDAGVHSLFLQNYRWMVTDYRSALVRKTAHTWTMPIEVWLGLLWTVLLSKLNKKAFSCTMIVIGLLGIMYRAITILTGCDVWTISLFPAAHMDVFAIGSLLAIATTEKKTNCWRLLLIGIVGILGIYTCVCYLSIINGMTLLEGYSLLSSSDNYLCNLLTGNLYFYIALCSASILGICVTISSQEMTTERILVKILIWVGDASYVLYLFHWPIREILKKYLSAWYTLFPSVLFMTIIVSQLYFKAYETTKRLLYRENPK